MSVARERSVAIIATGDELVLGASIDTNSAAIARAVQRLALEPRTFLVLGDDEDGLVRELVRLARDHAVIMVTGGLGPTLDDVTRHACARAAGVELVLDEAVLGVLRDRFAARNRPFYASNERQALFPRGASVITNPNGTADGFALEIGGALVVALPGPPREMSPMLEHDVLPRLSARIPAGLACAERRFFLVGLPESAFADAAGAWMARDANPIVGVTAKGGILSVLLRATAPLREQAEQLADERAHEMRTRLGAWIFSEDDPDLASVVVRALTLAHQRIAIAESCTGGLVAEKLTRIPGASAVFDFGWVTYANRAKSEQLDVDPALLVAHGAVSAEVASALARGAAKRSGADVAVSVTGIAGPDGGSASKPVGLVYFGLFARGVVSSEERRFLGLGRDLVRDFAANTALDLVRRSL